MEFIQNLIKKHWPIISILVFVVAVVVTNLKPGYLLIGNDNFSPELNPGLSLQRSLENPGWRGYRALGVASDSEQADIVRTSVYFLLELAGIPSWGISQGYMYFALACALFGAYKTAELFFARKKDVQWLALLTALAYVSSLLAVWIYFFPVHLFVAGFSFMPIVVWRFCVYIKDSMPLSEHGHGHEHTHALAPERKSLFWLALSSLLIATSALTATVFIVIFPAICIVAWAYYVHTYHSSAKRILLKGAGVILAMHLFWILPFAVYTISNTGDLQQSLINRKITGLQLQNETKYNTIFNSFRYFFSWIDDKDGATTFAYPARGWVRSVPGQLITFFMPIIALIGTFIAVKRKRWGFAIVGLTALGGVWLIKGDNPPLGFIYNFVQTHFPVFEQVFRWRSSKFWPLTALSMPLIFVFGITVISEKLNKKLKINSKITYIIAITLLLALIHPIFLGNFHRKSMYVKIPHEYFELAEYLQKTDPNGRIFTAPEANTLYFRNYSWGFFGSVFLNYILPNPIFEKALVIGSEQNEIAYDILINSIYSRNPRLYNNALSHFNMKYVLHDGYASTGVNGYAYDSTLYDEMIQKNKALRKVWQKGKLTLYELTQQKSKNVIFADRSNDIKKLSYTAIDKRYTYVMPEDTGHGGDIFPMQLQLNDVSFSQNILELSSRDALNGEYTYTLPPSVFNEMPTAISFQGKNVKVEPALPKITVDTHEIPVEIPHVRFTGESEFYSLGSAIVKNGEVVTLDTHYEKVSESEMGQWKEYLSYESASQDSQFQLYCNGAPIRDSITVGPSGMLCGTPTRLLDRDSVVKVSMSIRAVGEPLHGAVCVSDTSIKRCLNLNKFTQIGKEEKIEVYVPQIIERGRSFQVFFESKTLKNTSEFTIDSLKTTLYELSDTLEAESRVSVGKEQSFTLNTTKPTDITIRVPVIRSEWTVSTPFNVSYAPFTKGYSSLAELSNDSKLSATHSESSVSWYTDLPVDSGYDQAMIAIGGEFVEGIPADIRVKNVKNGAFAYENKLSLRGRTRFADTFYIPKGNPVLNAEIYSSALKKSQNRIDFIVIQPLPEPWTNLRLEKKVTRDLQVWGLNSAISPNRYIQNFNDDAGGSFIINGWEQGFVQQPIQQSSTPSQVVFWPDLVIYFGYALDIVLLMYLGIKAKFI